MITDQLKELERYKSLVTALESTIKVSLDAELASLPRTYGFDSVDAFARAVMKASSKPKRKPRAAGAAASSAKKTRRPRVTPEIKVQIKSAVEKGKTGAAIAKQFGISLATVHNVKKELGLVKART